MDLLDWQHHDDALWEAQIRRALHHHRSQAWMDPLRHKSLGLLFFNSSLRTRTSMELAAVQLGAHATTLNVGEGVWGFEWEDDVVMDGTAAEHIREAVGVLSRYYDALGVRVFATGTDYESDQSDRLLHRFAEAASVPVVSLESAFYHPCQALADAATLRTHFDGEVEGRKLVVAWAYHPRPLPMAVPNSALLMAARSGLDVTLACPEGFELDDHVLGLSRRYTEARGRTLTVSHDLDDALDGAHVVYAKAWGAPLRYQDADAEAALRNEHRDWRITADRMRATDGGAFMHCLPVRRGVVVDGAVLDGPQAIHLLQAEFRLHAQKAILEMLFDQEAALP